MSGVQSPAGPTRSTVRNIPSSTDTSPYSPFPTSSDIPAESDELLRRIFYADDIWSRCIGTAMGSDAPATGKSASETPVVDPREFRLGADQALAKWTLDRDPAAL